MAKDECSDFRRMVEAEVQKMRAEFDGADERRLTAMGAMIEQAACERIYLRQLNEQAMESGLVKLHPDDPTRQKTLPISGEITRHAASLTNITDKLMKHLAPDEAEDDSEMEDYV